MSYRALLYAIILELLCSFAYANSFPRGCEVSGFGYNQDHLIVNDTGKQSFYLIQNRSNNPIELERVETQEVFMSPTLHITLEPSKWAAFASDVENFHFACFTKENSQATKLDCQSALDICQYPRVKFALSNMGNYWVSANKTQNEVINEAIQKGIYLRW